MVFCASWRPWPSAIAAAEAVCAIRNRRCAGAGEARRTSHSTPTITRNASAKPSSGEITIGRTTLSRIAFQCTVMPEATPTPARPPISACVEDDGRPSHQVMRFQVIAPTSADSTITRPSCAATSPMLTMSCAIVVATCVPSSAPSRLNTAAMTSAALGVSARVDTEVAMAFAASWNPLV
jgi:hypothetical protein